MATSLRVVQPRLLLAQAARSQFLASSRSSRAFTAVSTSLRTAQQTAPLLTLVSPEAQHLAFALVPRRTLCISSARMATTAASRSSQRAKAEEQAQEEEGPDPDQPPPKASLKDRLKFLTKRYGWWALGVYMAASAVDLSLTFAAVHLLGADHIRGLEGRVRAKLGMEPRKEEDEDSNATPPPSSKPQGQKGRIASSVGDGNFWTEAVLAYTIHKTLLLPLRVAFTAAVTPSFVKWLVKMGWARANHQVRAQVAAKAAQKAAAKSAAK